MTKAEVIQAIQDRGYGTDLAAVQNTAARDAYNRLHSRRRWDWLRSSQTVSVAASSNALTFSSLTNYRTTEGVRIDGQQDPGYLPYNQFQTDLDTFETSTGLIQFWTLTATGLLFWPTPSVNVNVIVDFIAYPTDWDTLSDGSEVPVPTPLDEWIVWEAVAALCFRERDSQGRQDAKESSENIFIEYLNTHGIRQRQTSGEVVSTGIWETYTYEDPRFS
jgi:hypothetical protein